MTALNRFFLFLFRSAPLLGRPILSLLGAGIRRHPARFFDLFTATVPAVDRLALDPPGVRPLFHASMLEEFRQGARGAGRELVLYSRPWGFDLSRIAIPVDLWHGELDITVPPGMGESMARIIPNCRSRILSGEGHFSIPLRRMEEILCTLFAE
jgi:pimeloyl-ACP methyl ester carboxylesterase